MTAQRALFEPKLPDIPCPDCGELLVVRTVKQTGVRFYGCRSYPACTFTMDIPAYVHMLAAGAEMLPGFEL